MKHANNALQRWLITPFAPIADCLIRPDHFWQNTESKYVPPGTHQQSNTKRYFRLARAKPMVALWIPIFLCDSLFALVLASILWYFLDKPPDLPNQVQAFFITIFIIEVRLFLAVVLLSTLGGVVLDIAHGITLGLACAPIVVLAAAAPDVMIRSFSVFGALLFGTAFLNKDIYGDIIGSITFAAGTILFWLIECLLHLAPWNPVSLLSSVKLLVILIVMSLLLLAASRAYSRWIQQANISPPLEGPRIASSFSDSNGGPGIVWAILWFPALLPISLFRLLSLIINTGYTHLLDYLSPILSYVSVAFVETLFFTFLCLLCYSVGISRLLLYPYDFFSMRSAYIKSKHSPDQVKVYLEHSAAYKSECTFLPLPFLKQILFMLVYKNTPEAFIAVKTLILQKPQQQKVMQEPLWEMCTKTLEGANDLQALSRVYQKLQDVLPQRDEVVIFDIQRPSDNTILSTQEKFTDFDMAKPFLSFFDSSQKIATYFKEKLASQNRQMALLKEAISELPKATRYKTKVDRKLYTRLQRITAMWITLIEREKQKLSEREGMVGFLIQPYHAGASDYSNAPFVRRNAIFQNLKEAFREPCTLLLNGEQGMGKSSILGMLSKEDFAYIPILCNLQSIAFTSSTSYFLWFIAQNIQSYVPSARKIDRGTFTKAAEKNERAVYEVFYQWFHFNRAAIDAVLQPANRKFLLMFDEFDALQEAQEAGHLNLADLFHWLNRLQADYSIAVLFCGQRTFIELGEIWVRYFYNVQRIKVSFLQPTEALELIEVANHPNSPSTGQRLNTLIFDKEVKEEIEKITARQPFLIQALCTALIKHLNEKMSTKATLSDITDAVDKLFDVWHAYFSHLWTDKRTTNIQRMSLTILAQCPLCTRAELAQKIGIDEQELKRALNQLIERDMVTFKHEQYSVAIPLFAQWIQRFG